MIVYVLNARGEPVMPCLGQLQGNMISPNDAYRFGGFIFQLPPKFTPGSVRNGLCQQMISHHVFRRQIF